MYNQTHKQTKRESATTFLPVAGANLSAVKFNKNVASQNWASEYTVLYDSSLLIHLHSNYRR